MLDAWQVDFKRTEIAMAWCTKHGHVYMHYGAWDVFYRTKEQEEKYRDDPTHMEYSSINWLKVFDDLGLEKP